MTNQAEGRTRFRTKSACKRRKQWHLMQLKSWQKPKNPVVNSFSETVAYHDVFAREKTVEGSVPVKVLIRTELLPLSPVALRLCSLHGAASLIFTAADMRNGHTCMCSSQVYYEFSFRSVIFVPHGNEGWGACGICPGQVTHPEAFAADKQQALSCATSGATRHSRFRWWIANAWVWFSWKQREMTRFAEQFSQNMLDTSHRPVGVFVLVHSENFVQYRSQLEPNKHRFNALCWMSQS